MIKTTKLDAFNHHIIHGFSTIQDGNFKKIDQHNLSRLEIDPDRLIFSKQIHGKNIATVGLGHRKIYKNADGLITNRKKVFLAVFTADCIPILLFDPLHSIIGIIHAGWKGTLLNISKQSILDMTKLGADPKKIIAIIGPHIEGICYEVDNKRINLFRNRFTDYNGYIFQKNKKYYLDLGRLNFLELVKSGLDPKNIDSMTECTFCRDDIFYSYRRQGNSSGRMINFICLQN